MKKRLALFVQWCKQWVVGALCTCHELVVFSDSCASCPLLMYTKTHPLTVTDPPLLVLILLIDTSTWRLSLEDNETPRHYLHHPGLFCGQHEGWLPIFPGRTLGCWFCGSRDWEGEGSVVMKWEEAVGILPGMSPVFPCHLGSFKMSANINV